MGLAKHIKDHEIIGIDVADVTGLDAAYIKTDQTTPQTMVGTFTFQKVVATEELEIKKDKYVWLDKP